MRTTLTCLGLILLGAVATFATTPQYQQQYAQPGYKVYVPTYGAQYLPASAEGNTTLAEILAELKGIRQDLAAFRPQMPPADGHPPAGAPNALGILGAKCGACHEAGTADQKGGGFVMLQNGKLAPLSVAERKRMATFLLRDRMPPDPLPKLSEAEKQAVVTELGTQK